MREAYREVMDHIAVTEEMRGRVLQNIRHMDLPAKRIRPSAVWMRRLGAAACFAVLVAGAVALPQIYAPIQEEGLSGVQNGILNRTQASSLDELSQLVGFEVEGLGPMPFPVMEIRYTAYDKQMAEVSYMGEGQSLVYRKMAGRADPSGDYTAYSDVLILELGMGSVTLKGEAGTYCLALWEDDTYSYSARTSQAYSEGEWAQMLKPAK